MSSQILKKKDKLVRKKRYASHAACVCVYCTVGGEISRIYNDDHSCLVTTTLWPGTLVVCHASLGSYPCRYPPHQPADNVKKKEHREGKKRAGCTSCPWREIFGLKDGKRARLDAFVNKGCGAAGSFGLFFKTFKERFKDSFLETGWIGWSADE